MQKYLYHYTDPESFIRILNAGCIKLTDSNLIAPKAGKEIVKVNEYGRLVHTYEGADYKPVVWLTSMDQPNEELLGLSSLKTQVRIAVEYNVLTHVPWSVFADRNGMDKKWRSDFEYGRAPKTWFISESPIPVSVEKMETGEIAVTMTCLAEQMINEMCGL